MTKATYRREGFLGFVSRGIRADHHRSGEARQPAVMAAGAANREITP